MATMPAAPPREGLRGATLCDQADAHLVAATRDRADLVVPAR